MSLVQDWWRGPGSQEEVILIKVTANTSGLGLLFLYTLDIFVIVKVESAASAFKYLFGESYDKL